MDSFWKIFADKRRERKCVQNERSKFVDFFLYSDVNDYRELRIIVNFFFGLLICSAVYYMVWKRLNFFEFNVYAAFIFQIVFVVAASWAFAKSTVFRCAIICVCLGALGRTGQGLFSLFVIERLSDGPIDNIVHNFQLTSSIVICHLEIQSKVTAQRITLAAGPVEALLEKHLGNSVSAGQKMIHTLKALIEPFNSELKTSNEEDDKMAAVIDNAQALSDRQYLVEGGDVMTNESTTDSLAANQTSSSNASLPDDARPVWARFKSALARAVSRRFVHRCEEMFSGAVKNCHEKFENVQSLCYEKTPFFIAFFTCRRLNALTLCQPGQMTSLADKYCERGLDMEGNASSLLTPDLDDQLNNVQNVSQEISSQLKMNLHFQAIEEPTREQIRALDEIKAEIQGDVDTFKVALNTFEDVLSAVLVLLLYWIFRDAVKMITSYLSDFDYRNNFLTGDFWYTDAKRRIREKSNFSDRPFTEEEIEHHNLQYPLSWPTFGEAIGSWLPVLRWLVLVLIVFIVVVLDHYYYRVLMLVVRFGGKSGGGKAARTSFVGQHTLEINVKGNGPIAEMIKDILNFNFTKTAREDLTNEMCLTTPRAPDWAANVAWLFAPLLVMLFLQMVFSFIISRITLLYILSFVFRQRAKARTKYLYRKLTAYREGRHLRAQKLGLIMLEVPNERKQCQQRPPLSPWR